MLCGILLNCNSGLTIPLATLRSLGSPETVTGEEFYVESGGVYAVCSLDYTTDLVTLDPLVSFLSVQTIPIISTQYNLYIQFLVVGGSQGVPKILKIFFMISKNYFN